MPRKALVWWGLPEGSVSSRNHFRQLFQEPVSSTFSGIRFVNSPRTSFVNNCRNQFRQGPRHFQRERLTPLTGDPACAALHPILGNLPSYRDLSGKMRLASGRHTQDCAPTIPGRVLFASLLSSEHSTHKTVKARFCRGFQIKVLKTF